MATGVIETGPFVLSVRHAVMLQDYITYLQAGSDP